MKLLKKALMLMVSPSVLYVWLFRFNEASIFRGGQASNMIEEFAAYGLNENLVYVVGGLKVLGALGLLGGLFNRKIILPSAILIAVLMFGAIWMHFKIGDEPVKYLPSAVLFLMSLGIIFLDRKEKAPEKIKKRIRS